MEDFIKKISGYDILNNILPGVIFIIVLKNLFEVEIEVSNIIESIFLYYGLGITISRIGAIVVRKLLKRIVCYENYSTYLKASKIDSKIIELNCLNNMYRTFIALISILFCINIYFIFAKCYSVYYYTLIIFIILILLFIKSYKRNTAFIVKRIKCVLNEYENCGEKNDRSYL